jgi:hypothetical protein
MQTTSKASRHFGVRANSSLLPLTADLGTASNIFFGFRTDEQQQILKALPDFG